MTDVYQWAEFGTGLFTWFIAVPVYIVFLYTLIRYRNLTQFNTAFYHLVFQCGLLDMWFVLHQYLLASYFWVNHVFVKMSKEIFLWANIPIATIAFYGYFYIRACQAMSVLGISLNRFTALCMPLRHDLIWTKKATWITIIVQTIVAIVALFPGVHGRCVRSYVRIVNGSDYEFDRLSPACISRILGPSLILVMFLSVILIVLYFIMFLKARHGNIVVGHGNQTENDQKLQRNLAIGGAIISGTLVLNTTFLLVAMTVLSRSSTPPFAGLFRKILDTLFCIVNPFVLLCFGTKVRPYYWKCVKRVFRIKEEQQIGDNDDHEMANIGQKKNKENKNNDNKNKENKNNDNKNNENNNKDTKKNDNKNKENKNNDNKNNENNNKDTKKNDNKKNDNKNKENKNYDNKNNDNKNKENKNYDNKNNDNKNKENKNYDNKNNENNNKDTKKNDNKNKENKNYDNKNNDNKNKENKNYDNKNNDNKNKENKNYDNKNNDNKNKENKKNDNKNNVNNNMVIEENL